MNNDDQNPRDCELKNFQRPPVEAWLGGMISRPELIDQVAKTESEKQKWMEALQLWKEAGYPPLSSQT